MSKAFVPNDGDNSDADNSFEGKRDAEELQDESLFKGITKNYMTPACAERLQSELRHLLNEERPKVVNTVAWAAGNGDRSENGDYIYGKRRLREIDRRIRFLTRRLDRAEVVDPKNQKADKVLFGATVTLAWQDSQTESVVSRVVRIVGIDESNAQIGDISWIAPLAKAIFHSRVGDVVNFRSPKGEEELEIIKIEYK